MEIETETFIAKLRQRQDGVMEITIPKNVVDFGGYKDEDLVKIMMKRQTE